MVDDILCARPSTKPEVLVDTLEGEEEVIEDNEQLKTMSMK